MKKILSVAIVILLAVSLLILSPLALNTLGGINYATSDFEAYGDGVFYYIDADASGCVYSDVPGTDERIWFTDYAADAICLADEKIFVSEGSRIHSIDMKTLEDKVVAEAASDIDRFAYTGGSIFYLSDGSIYVRKALSGDVREYVSGGVTGFWLDAADKLSYTNDKTYIHTVDLLTGKTENSVNMWSDLGDEIPVKQNPAGHAGQASDQDETIFSLQAKFPDGRYWNHGSGANNPDGTTSRPCTHHGTNGSGCNYSGSCGCNCYASAIQCMGYAFKCGHDVTGYNPSSGSGGWSISTDKSKVDYIKAGDVIRYRNDGHSIYITGVFGDTCTYTDCNSDSHCVIRWNRTVSKATIKSTFTKIYVSPFDAGVYQIQFDPNGGTCETEAKTVEQGMTYGELPRPEREGYIFDGWFTDLEEGTIVTPDSIVDLSKTYRLYAHWTLIVYDIVYDANGENVSKLPPKQRKDYNETIELNNPAPERTGYTFVEWNTVPDGTGTKFAYGVKYTNNSNLTLYAVWKANDYYVTLEKNGGICSGSNIHVLYDHPYGYDAKLGTKPLPVPVKIGFDFVGWYTEKNGGTPVTDETLVKTVGNHTIYAKYAVTKYTVTFDANGGSGGPAAQIFEYGTSTVIPSNYPSREGYDFLYWSTSSDGTGRNFYAGNVYNEKANLKLYAVWKIKTYSVTYNANTGSGAPSAQIKEYGKTLKISDELPKKPGYVLVSWNTESDGTGRNYDPGEEYTTNANLNLYAKWALGNYTVTYLSRGGSCDKKTDVFTYSSIYPELPVPVKEGYTFDGWYLTKVGGTRIKSGDIVALTEDTYFYAHWSPLRYNVAYYAEGGENLPANQYKEYNVYLVLSDKVPVKSGYTFEGWNTEKEGTGTMYRPGEIYTENKTVVLYAQWKPVMYTVAYSTEDGTGLPQPQTKEYGKTLILSETRPERKGFSFGGWNTSYDYSGNAYTAGGSYTDNASAVLYAVWIPEKIKVTFDEGNGSTPVTADFSVGRKYGNLPEPESEGKIFTGWYSDLDKTVMVYPDSLVTATEDTTLYAGWSDTSLVNSEVPNRYYAAFFADGKEITKVQYTKGDAGIEEPQVPTKPGYTGKWSDYSLQDGGTAVLAVYTPNEYTASFVAEGKTVASLKYTVETKHIAEPEVPEKDGYKASWKGYTLQIGGVAVEANYTPITYYAHFIADGKEKSRTAFTVKTGSIAAPSVPQKEGYDGNWTQYTLKTEDIYVYAVYTPVVYEGKFTADGKTVFTFTYTVEDTVTDEPEVPGKTGYTGKWDKQAFPAGGTEIKAIYTPNTYNVHFFVYGAEAYTVSYTYGAKSIKEPALLDIPGYAAKWTAYTLGAADSDVQMVFTPITYYATFVADGQVVAQIPYTVETKSIQEPDIPVKPNTNSHWEKYELDVGGVTVNAIYLEKPYIRLISKKNTFAMYRLQTFLGTVEFGNLDEGMTLRWYVDGIPVDNDNSETLLLSKVEKNFTVEAKIIDKDGNVVESTIVLKVTVVRSFFRTIIEFFKNLAKKPTIRTP